MIITYEARLPAKTLGGDDRSRIHRQVDALLLPDNRTETPRNYIWGRVDDTVVVRSERAREAFFSLVELPGTGSFTFEFDAAPKTGHCNKGRKTTRKPVLGKDRLDEWARSKLLSCGIEISDLDVMPYIASTAKCPNLFSAFFAGSGDIIDANAFFQAAVHGISGAGPKCWGFGTLIINWS